MNISLRLKQARKSKGYTQEALANAIGMSRGVITNIEYGKAEPNALIVRAICEVLGINESWLLTGEGSMENSADYQKSARLLAEIYRSARELSEAEQDYILEMIHAFQKYRHSVSSDDSDYPAGEEQP